MYVHFEPLGGSAFGVAADLSRVQLNARLAPLNDSERALQGAYSWIIAALYGKKLMRLRPLPRLPSSTNYCAVDSLPEELKNPPQSKCSDPHHGRDCAKSLGNGRTSDRRVAFFGLRRPPGGLSGECVAALLVLGRSYPQ